MICNRSLINDFLDDVFNVLTDLIAKIKSSLESIPVFFCKNCLKKCIEGVYSVANYVLISCAVVDIILSIKLRACEVDITVAVCISCTLSSKIVEVKVDLKTKRLTVDSDTFKKAADES